jgi:hypothetical protein
MEFTKKYFDTVEEAEAFIQIINTLLGIPVSEDAVTRTYTEPIEENGKWYVEYESNLIENE